MKSILDTLETLQSTAENAETALHSEQLLENLRLLAEERGEDPAEATYLLQDIIERIQDLYDSIENLRDFIDN